MPHSTLNTQEVHQFSEISHKWWDEKGPFRPLHELNPTRLTYIIEAVSAHFPLNKDPHPLKDLRILDLGCGGGLISEPMCRLGASVMGIDASQSTIAVAKDHALQMGLTIDYQHTCIEDLVKSPPLPFDIILAMEVVEHVEHVQTFIDLCMELLKPGGVLILSTINRTWKAYLMAIIGAEYILKWLPKGTHDWHKFLKPAELASYLRSSGGKVTNISGMGFCPLKREWSLTPHVDVNYLMTAVK